MHAVLLPAVVVDEGYELKSRTGCGRKYEPIKLVADENANQFPRDEVDSF